MTWFRKLKDGLKKTSQKMSQGITQILTHKKLDDAVLDSLEELLILTDMGVTAAQKLTGNLRKSKFGQDVTEEDIKESLAHDIAAILKERAGVFKVDETQKPYVVLMVGVNGGGKTTSIAKLTHQLKEQNLKIMMVAGDTFRAAAIGQLGKWAERLDVTLFSREPGGDAAGLAYDAIQKARKENYDVVFIDTAGRLHNNHNLMQELEKITRVIKKVDPALPHAALMTVDGTSGQNVLNQIEAFGKIVPLTGIIMTKLDGTSKGGILVQVASRFEVPIVAVGVGEKPQDMNPFDPDDFARHLMGLSTTDEDKTS